MKETKVYVDELPESCKKCAYSQINLALGVETRICGLQYGFISIDIDKFPNCPLQSIKTHDRELVKEVCEKIKYKLGSIEDILINLGNGKEDALNYFTHILNEIEKEFEK